MAINISFKGARIQPPGLYGFPPGWNSKMYGIPVSEVKDWPYHKAKITYNLLKTLENLELFRNVSMTTHKILNDNELYYDITIWEDPDYESRKQMRIFI